MTEESNLFASVLIGLGKFEDNLLQSGLTFDQIVILVHEGIPAKNRPTKTAVKSTLQSLLQLHKQFKKVK